MKKFTLLAALTASLVGCGGGGSSTGSGGNSGGGDAPVFKAGARSAELHRPPDEYGKRAEPAHPSAPGKTRGHLIGDRRPWTGGRLQRQHSASLCPTDARKA